MARYQLWTSTIILITLAIALQSTAQRHNVDKTKPQGGGHAGHREMSPKLTRNHHNYNSPSPQASSSFKVLSPSQISWRPSPAVKNSGFGPTFQSLDNSGPPPGKWKPVPDPPKWIPQGTRPKRSAQMPSDPRFDFSNQDNVHWFGNGNRERVPKKTYEKYGKPQRTRCNSLLCPQGGSKQPQVEKTNGIKKAIAGIFGR